MNSEVYIDPSLECDAPTFVDFTNITSQYDDNADAWFDKPFLNAQGEKFSNDFTENLKTQPSPEPEPSSGAKSVPSPVVIAPSSESNNRPLDPEATEEANGVLSSPVRTDNMPLPEVTMETDTVPSTEPDGDTLPPVVPSPVVKPDSIPSPFVKKKTAQAVLDALNNPKPFEFKGNSKDGHLESSVRKPVKSTEQIQMEEIKRLQLEAKKKLRSSRRSFMKLAKGAKPVKVVKGSKPPTEVKEFSFSKPVAAEGRNASFTQSDHVHPSNFANTLRTRHASDNIDGSTMSSKKPPTPEPATKPKPFKFELDKRPGLRSSTTASKDNLPMAEFIAKYEKATPPRFRHVSSGKKPPPAPEKEDFSSGSRVTLPKTPNLLTRTRKRPLTHKSAAEIEEEEAVKIKRYQFKATLLNPDIIKMGGVHGVPCRKNCPQLTHPVSPQLATKKLASARKAATEEDEPDFEAEDRKFVAQPMPNFTEIQGLPAKRARPVTQPESPAIKKRRRLDTAGKSDEEVVSHVIKANPVPNFEKVFEPQYPQRVVVPEPFSFEERDKNKNTKETLVQRILNEEKKPEFKAQPIPSTTFQPSAPPKAAHTITRPQPYNLHTEIRGEQHTQKWKEELEKQAQQEKQNMEFKAREVSAKLYNRPFTAEKSTKPLTRVDNKVLHSEVRSNQRAKYETERKQRAYTFEVENLQRRALREAEEAKEIAKLRRSLVHKAQPIGHYAPVVVKPSVKPVTQPMSPHFEVDKVLQKHHTGSRSKV